MNIACKIFGHKTMRTRLVKCGEKDPKFMAVYGPDLKYIIRDEIECERCGLKKSVQTYYHDVVDLFRLPIVPNPKFMVEWEDKGLI